VPRIREITHDDATTEQEQLLDDDLDAYGQVLNTTRLWAHAPDLLPHIRSLHGALADSSLPDDLVSLTRLRVAQINGCPF
jgi:alkylhydroperoxidase family enzyme